MYNGESQESTVIEVQQPKGESTLTKIALALSTVAFSGMGLFLVQWGRAQETILTHDRTQAALEQDLDSHKKSQERLNNKVSKQLGSLDTRTARTADLVESIAKKLDVPVPPPRR